MAAGAKEEELAQEEGAVCQLVGDREEGRVGVLVDRGAAGWVKEELDGAGACKGEVERKVRDWRKLALVAAMEVWRRKMTVGCLDLEEVKGDSCWGGYRWMEAFDCSEDSEVET